MTCQDFCDVLMEYLDGHLAPAARAELEAHLSECEDCVRYLDSYRKTVAAARSTASQPPVVEPMPEPLVRAILQARRRMLATGE